MEMSNNETNERPGTTVVGRPRGGLCTKIVRSDGQAFACDLCPPGRTRTFGDNRGLSQHKRRVHKEQYHDTNLPAPRSKRRWSSDELYLLQSTEAALMLEDPDVYNVNQVLYSRLYGHLKPGEEGYRGFDGVKSKRRGDEYSERVKQLMADLRGKGGAPDNGNRLLEPIEEHTGDGPCQPIKEVVDSSELEEWRNSLLQAIWKTEMKFPGIEAESLIDPDVSSSQKVRDAIDAMWPDNHDDRKKAPSRAENQKAPPKARTNRARRRMQYARVQRSFARDRGRCAQKVLDGDWRDLGDTKSVPLSVQEPFWRSLFERPSDPDVRKPTERSPVWSILKPISRADVKSMLGTIRKSAPGPDGLTAKDILKTGLKETAAHFNLWLLVGYIPAALKRALTILLPKIKGTQLPAEHRPITISSIVLRCYHGIIARRMSRDIAWSPHQRAFVPGDGIAVSAALIQRLMRRAKTNCKPLYMAFVDVRKAFDSVNHESMLKAAAIVGVPPPFVEYLAEFYSNATTCIRVDGRYGAPIKLGRGVRQGDPLSGCLFNAVIEWVLSSLDQNVGVNIGDNGAEKEVKIAAAAFADDITIMSESREGLQHQMDILTEQLRLAGLEVSAGANGKSKTMAIVVDGRRKMWVCDRRPFLKVNGERLAAIAVNETQKYLGIHLSPYITRAHVDEVLKVGLDNLGQAPLKPQQRLHILTKHLLPRLMHQLVLAPCSAKYLRNLDRMTRSAVRKWLHWPRDANVPSFHARVTDGGLGIALLEKQIPILKAKRLSRIRDSTDPVSRFIIAGLAPTPPASFAGVRVKTVNELKETIATQLYSTVDGKGLQESSLCKQQHGWVDGATNLMKGSAFICALKVRYNLVTTPHRLHRAYRERSVECDCCRRVCSLAHILQSCPRTHLSRVARHDRVLNALIGRCKKKGWTVVKEPRIPTPSGYLKPDLVLAKDGRTLVLDVTVSCDNGLTQAYSAKVAKYNLDKVKVWAAKWGTDAGKGKIVASQVEVNCLAVTWRGLFARDSVVLIDKLGLGRPFLNLLSVITIEKGWAIVSHFNSSTWKVRNG